MKKSIQLPLCDIPRINLNKGQKNCPQEIALMLDELTTQHRCILFVVINGASVDVGKTYVKTLVIDHLWNNNIPYTIASHTRNDLSNAVAVLESSRRDNPNFTHPGVIVSDDSHCIEALNIEKANTMRERADALLQSNSNGSLKVNLWIGVERPAKRFEHVPLADILVQNLGAKDKTN